MNKTISKLFTGLLLLAVSMQSFGQGRTITGTIKDSSNGIPIPGATVLVKGTTNGVATNLEGYYELTLSSNDSIIIVSYVGYEAVEININGNTVINVDLNISMTELDCRSSTPKCTT